MDFTRSFTTAFALAAGTTAVGGSDFVSQVISIPRQTPAGSIAVTFAAAAGSASLTADFYFQVSRDHGQTWSNYVDPVTGLECISVLTGHAPVSGTTVAVMRLFDLRGFDSIRLAQVVNNDVNNGLTAVNASIGFNII